MKTISVQEFIANPSNVIAIAEADGQSIQLIRADGRPGGIITIPKPEPPSPYEAENLALYAKINELKSEICHYRAGWTQCEKDLKASKAEVVRLTEAVATIAQRLIDMVGK